MGNLNIFNAKSHFSFQDDPRILSCTMILIHMCTSNAALFWKTGSRNLKTTVVFKKNVVDILHFFFNRGYHGQLILFFFFFLWLCWVFVSVRGLSLVAASGGYSSSRCAGLSLSRPLSLRSTGSRRAGSVIVAHGPSRSAACGIFPDQSSNPCPLHWQADSQPLRHQGSPQYSTF